MSAQVANSVLLHWNVRGLISKGSEFKQLFSTYSPLVASIQETHFRDDDLYKFYIPNYSLFSNNINSGSRRGGVALYISDSLVHRSLALSTHLNAVAVEVMLYITSIPPGEDNFSISDVRSLFVEVLAHGPFVLLGDLNAHHPLWGSSHESGRGTEIDALLTDFNLVCLNDGSPTYLSSTYRTFSSIDLAIVTPFLASWFQFTVEDDPQFSDHFPFKGGVTRATFPSASGSSAQSNCRAARCRRLPMDRWRPVGQRRAALGNSDGVARGLADFAYVTLTSQGSSGAADTTRRQRAAAAIVDGILKRWKVEVSVYFFWGEGGHCLPTLGLFQRPLPD